jgi:sugar lactone lactonase YvrE
MTLLSAIAVAGFAATQAIAPAFAATAPLSQVREVAHFDITLQQQPENITLEPDGAADVTFNRARQIARVTPDGRTTILATLPAPASGSATASGIVRAADGTLYVNYNAGSLSGVWRLRPGGTPEQVAALPEVKVVNGLALDERTDTLYVTDSSSGTVWKVSPRTGETSLWAGGEALQPATTNSSGFGVNGIKVHDGAVWVSNTDKGTLLRIPIGAHGAAGAVTTQAEGLTSIDDFSFVGQGDTVLAAQNFANSVALVNPDDGTHTTVLTVQDGLSGPTSVAVRGKTVYVTSGAYFTRTDPNLLLARVDRAN